MVPHSPQRKVGGLRAESYRWYDCYDRLCRILASSMLRFSGKQFVTILSRVLVRDALWRKIMVRRARSADVVEIHNRPSYVFDLRRSGYRGRIILHMHNDLADYITRDKFPQLESEVDDFVFCSAFIMRRAITHFAAPSSAGASLANRSRVLYNGVSSRYEKLGERNPLLLMYAGRVNADKGVLEVIRVCDNLAARGYDVSLEVLGGTGSGKSNPETPYLRRVHEEAARANARHARSLIKLAGPVEYSEVVSRMSEASLLILPSRWEEPFGMVAVEAMSAGVIPVVADRGGLPEVVGEAGSVVQYFEEPEAQVDQFVEVVEQLLSSPIPESSRDYARSRAATFGWGAIARDAGNMLTGNSDSGDLGSKAHGAEMFSDAAEESCP